MKLGLAVLDFGGPMGPDELVPFLTALLEDVLPGPMAVKRLVAPAIAKRRSVEVGPNYEMIGWSPLVPNVFFAKNTLKLEKVIKIFFRVFYQNLL